VSILAKNQRLELFCERLQKAQPFSSGEEAYLRLAAILVDVEDEFSGIPNNPATWQTDGRLYPPQQDTKRIHPNCPSIVRYRSVAHNTLIGENGSIRIETITGQVVLNKCGADGLTVADLERGGLTMQEPAGYRYNAMDEDLERFHSLLLQRLHGALVHFDSSQVGTHHCWIDIRLRNVVKSVEFRAGQGFGIFADAPSYGEGPVTICPNADEAFVRVANLFGASS
jgi:hypothetical protein